MRKFGLLFLALAAWSLSLAASAQSCGTVLTASVTLTHDMDCAGFPYAFRVAANGVTISLNGYRIHSDASNDGIVVINYHHLSIRGPGRIDLFNDAVYALRADYLGVSGVEFANHQETGIALITSRAATVQRNRFHGFMEVAAIDIRQPIGLGGSGAGGHVIADNVFENVFEAIGMCGADAGNNRIYGNTFADIVELAVQTFDEAGDNVINYNKFRAAGGLAVLFESGRNVFDGNVFEAGAYGVQVRAPAPAGCVTRATTPTVFGNRVLNNKFYATSYPVEIAAGSGNRIGGNLIQDAVIGIAFGKASSYNDATGNTFPGTTTPVRDYGVGNVY
jgi:hypothetical protein